jgi:phosphoribosylamine--glycine ligase
MGAGSQKRNHGCRGRATGRATRVGSLDGEERNRGHPDALRAPYVVKADGLAGGKGVLVTTDRRCRGRSRRMHWIGRGSDARRGITRRPGISSSFSATATMCSRSKIARDYKRLSDNGRGPGLPAAWAPLSPLHKLPAGFVDEVIDTIAGIPTIAHPH